MAEIWPSVVTAGTAAIVGSVLASFTTTAALRATEERSALKGRSQCDGCGRTLSYSRMVPVWSYLRLGGACEDCGASIPRWHIVGELLGALSAVAIVAFTPPATWTPLALAAAALLFAAIFDLSRFRIPDPTTALIAVSGLAVAMLQNRPLEAVATGLAVGVALVAVTLLYWWARGRSGLGLGDVKLLMALAIWVGPLLTPIGVSLAAALGLCGCRLGLGRGEVEPHRRIAFAPFIALAFWPLLLGRLAT